MSLLHTEVLNLMKDLLKLDSLFLDSMGHLRIEKIPFGTTAKHKREVIVRFQTIEAMNIVRMLPLTWLGMFLTQMSAWRSQTT